MCLTDSRNDFYVRGTALNDINISKDRMQNQSIENRKSLARVDTQLKANESSTCNES